MGRASGVASSACLLCGLKTARESEVGHAAPLGGVPRGGPAGTGWADPAGQVVVQGIGLAKVLALRGRCPQRARYTPQG